MQNDWILDVLADLRNFARSNGLPKLSEHLEDTALLAACELASSPRGGDARGANGTGSGLDRDLGGLGAGFGSR
ncbi:hypothetical protein DZK27_08135 [Rhodobacteraceae bacterium 63075]|nr:hypothetical protein DZK27_08135 [Rhodobacteraceae bacterium 63075]